MIAVFFSKQVHHMEYIIRRKAAAHSGGQVCFEYVWGECAHSEISQEQIKAFIENLFNKQQQRRELVYV
eukprot:617244-Pelagomonas_calceolata.AAC.3